MKILIAGAFGNLGSEITKAAVGAGHAVMAADRVVKKLDGLDSAAYSVREIDVTKPETLAGLCDGADIVITTVGLTTGSAVLSHYDVDLQGNINILNEAKRAGVGKFIFTSVIKAETDGTIPMLDAKNKFEIALKASGLQYFIIRPSGYFYDIAKVFRPMVEKGRVLLLAGTVSKANVIDTSDLADYIVSHLDEQNKTVEIGGMETHTYEEIARMFFEAAGKVPVIKYVPKYLFTVLAWLAKIRRNGKYAGIKFGEWTLSHDMEASIKYGKKSFREYISGHLKKKERWNAELVHTLHH